MRCCSPFLFLFHISLVLLWIISGAFWYVSHVYGPTLEFKNTQFSLDQAGKDHLDACETSTNDFEDLIIDSTFTSNQVDNVLRIHGSAIFPSILTKETAQSLRDYATKANQELAPLYVHSSEHRYHIIPPHSEPIVQETLKQIAEHPVLRPALDSLLGPSATLMSLSLLTSEYGAGNQDYHYDSEWSYHGYPDQIVPEYTVAIALQDTTRGMGATGICPGTHVCSWPDDEEIDDRMLWESFQQARRSRSFEGTFEDWALLHFPCQLTATMRQGDALVYSSDLIHAGRAHTEPDSPQRVQAFITFAASRQGPVDTRHLPIGNFYSLNWNMWGQTIDDFSTMKERAWRPWHSFGLLNGKTNVRPWTLWDAFLVIFRHPDQTADMFLSEEWNAVRFTEFADKLLRISIGYTVVYASTILLCLTKKRSAVRNLTM
jgi:hypothetical protein